MSTAERAASSVRAVFEPASVAIIGASTNPDSVGSRAARYFRASGFNGAVYQVNPRQGGRDGFITSLSELPPGAVDLALLMVRRERIMDALRECAAHRVRAAIIGAAGFSESGAAGRSEQDEITELARTSGMRIVGPNSLGVVNVASGNYATFASLADPATVRERGGSVAIASQSGAVASFLVATLAAVGVSCPVWLSTGNEADVDIADAIDYLSERADISMLVVYLEGVRDGSRLGAALAHARQAGKVVAVLKAGRSKLGAQAVASHTAAIAGADAVYDALFRRCGAIRLETFTELVTLAQLVDGRRELRGRRLAVLTVSGGVGALIADAADASDLDLPKTPPSVADALAGLFEYASLGNPIDLTGQVANNPEQFREVTNAIRDVDEYDAVMIFAGPALVDPRYGGPLLDAAVELRRDSDKVVVVCGAPEQYAFERLAGSGVALVPDPLIATSALGHLAAAAAAMPVITRNPQFDLPAGLRHDLAVAPSTALDENSSKDLLRSVGIRVPRSRVTTSAAQASRFAQECGTAVVVKAIAASLAHKSDRDLVRIGLHAGAEVEHAWTAVRGNAVRAGFPHAQVLVEEHIAQSVEMLVDLRVDALFGLVVTVGAGGIFAEMEHDTVTWVGVPDRAEFERDLRVMLRSAHRLIGTRGRAPSDLDALHNLLVSLAALMCAPGVDIVEIELNPVSVQPAGEGVIALDAVVFAARHESAEDR